MDVPNYRLVLNEFHRRYEQIYHKKCVIEKYMHILESFIHVCIRFNLIDIQLL